MSEKIAAVVVTYNRKKLLKECLDAIIKQTRPLNSIILIDNASTDGTSVMLKDKGYLDLEIMDYVMLEKNTGGAGGFYEGVKRGYDKGFDWLWLMDDDAEPKKNCLERLIYDKKNKSLGIICPLIIHEKTRNIQWYHHKILDDSLFKDISIDNMIDSEEILKSDELIEIDANAFVGPLINCKVIKKLGLPEKDYFIWSDDLEYTYRISRKYKCFLDSNSKIYHKDNNYTDEGNISSSTIWKRYYGIRNRLLFVLKHQDKIKYKYKYILITFMKSVKAFFSLLLKYKAGRYSFLPFKAFFDGITNNKGDNVKPFKL